MSVQMLLHLRLLLLLLGLLSKTLLLPLLGFPLRTLSLPCPAPVPSCS